MEMQEIIDKLSKMKINPKLAAFLEQYINAIPMVRREIDKQTDEILGELEKFLRPYKSDYDSYTHIPENGRDKQGIIDEMKTFKELESKKWKDGYVTGAVYNGSDELTDFLNEVYTINSHSNPLHFDLFPSSGKYEAEIISMTANMLGAEKTRDEICGAVSSGGTESIMLAMKTYRDWARAEKKITKPNMVVPDTAHAAFDKASECFGIKMIRVPMSDDYRADVKAMKKAINKNTIVLIGSAPNFPHGLIDPIKELARIAKQKKIGMHVDACLGGFILPWIEKLGHNVPPFDFRLPGVTSMSSDTHKYAYASKGTSVVLYRGKDLRKYQYFTSTDWPGGLYFSPTFAGSRPGGLSAACWAAMVAMGENGYMEATAKILKAADTIKEGIKSISNIHLIGNPYWNISFASDSLNIYEVMEIMSQRGWTLSGLHKPSAVHICLTLRQAQEGVAEKFVEDLKEAVTFVKENPSSTKGMAPVYGMGATLPLRGVISDMLIKYMDTLYEV